MTAATSPPVERILLEGVSWETYERLLEEAGTPGKKFTYDDGLLEIMTKSSEHGITQRLVGRLVEAMTEVLGIPIKSGGDWTLKRAVLKKGLEPDESYWVTNESKVRSAKRLDIEVDPPPDLAIEVEITHSALDKMSIYAALRVPELWRWADDRLVFHRLADGKYAEISVSREFPFLTAADLMPFLRTAGTVDETTWIRGFRKWVETELAPRVKAPPT